MTQLDRNWPPLIIARKKSLWIMLRDAVLTAIMWIIFCLMLEGELELLLPSYVERSGLRTWLARLGFSDLPFEPNLPDFIHAIAPYFGVSLLLIILMLSFAVDTIRRRRSALRGPRPPLLDPATEARQAELSTMAGYAGPAIKVVPLELPDAVALDPRRMLAVLDRRDEVALAEVRALRVTWVDVTPDGHCRILPSGSA